MNDMSVEWVAEAIYSNVLSAVSHGWCRSEDSFNSSNIAVCEVLSTILKMYKNPDIQKMDSESIIHLSLLIAHNMNYEDIQDEDSRASIVSTAIKDYKKSTVSTIDVGDKLYSMANPDSKMNTPSVVYETVDTLKEEWIADYPTMNGPSFWQYCCNQYKLEP